MEYTTMSKAEQNAFSLVAEACKADVQKLCSTSVDAKKRAVTERHLEQPPPPPVLLPDFFLQPPPLLQAVTFHSFEEIEKELDEIIQSFFAPLPPPPPREQPLVFVRSVSASELPNSGPPRRPPCPYANKHINNNNVDGLIQQLSVQTRPEHYGAVSEKLHEKGRDMMTTAVHDSDNKEEPHVDDSVIVTARRLQEVTPDTLHSFRRSFLPFAEADCLEKAYQAHKVSKLCAETMDNLHAVRADAQLQLEQAEREEWDVFFNLLTLYLLIFGTILIVLVKSRKYIRRQLRLRERILITIYSEPAVKRAVEAALGRSIGHEPPLGGLLRRDAKSRAMYRASRRIRLAVLCIMLVLCIFAPDKVLPFACGVAGFCFWTVVFASWGKSIKARECTCCCCGTTTTAAAQGLGDACCKCCSGTGVCSLECASCCNPSDDDDSAGACACCGGAGCCCCSGCCCCGSNDGAATVKDSTGCCDGCSCCCCCGSTKKSASNELTKRSSTTVVTVTKGDKSESVIYENVPIMIV